MYFRQDISVPYALKEGHFRELKLKVPFKSLLSKASQYNQKIKIVPKMRYTEIQQQQKNLYKVLQTPPTSIHLLHHIPFSRNHPVIFPGFGIAIWKGRGDRRATVLPATSAGLEPRLPSCVRPQHAFHCTKFFMLRPA